MADIFHKSGILAAASVALGLAVMPTQPVSAATIKYDFTVDVETGNLAGNSYQGYFTYDDTFQFDSGFERFNSRNDDLSVVFDFNGVTYTEEDDFLFPEGPYVDFQDGELLGLNFVPSLFTFDFPFEIRDEDNDRIGGDFFTYGDFFIGSGDGSVTYAKVGKVPEPATILGLSVLGASLLLGKKKGSSQNA
ncbi:MULTISPECIES: PEP-CTERM sorting domain-containing protein [unclassified Moorena]|uniref:PEP-CTERM sorting domain-containing protein n=2 Tax=Moorena TaxID=1155738 RepID=UPI001400DAD3|nr:MULTISPECIES: PEP-CTERM sorting domain-containing protein [unclassified Moorena]NEO11611.1 PEP-CTERM sorting domain-containing protein [Moorena sp. SIO3E8]NEP99742.1 PEP-CTERM sorting domain-containing protein [Moorena sp. SIO3F7]